MGEISDCLMDESFLQKLLIECVEYAEPDQAKVSSEVVLHEHE